MGTDAWTFSRNEGLQVNQETMRNEESRMRNREWRVRPTDFSFLIPYSSFLIFLKETMRNEE
jgi:hypothetical protein